jgi:hypothetical protein
MITILRLKIITILKKQAGRNQRQPHLSKARLPEYTKDLHGEKRRTNESPSHKHRDTHSYVFLCAHPCLARERSPADLLTNLNQGVEGNTTRAALPGTDSYYRAECRRQHRVGIVLCAPIAPHLVYHWEVSEWGGVAYLAFDLSTECMHSRAQCPIHLLFRLLRPHHAYYAHIRVSIQARLKREPVFRGALVRRAAEMGSLGVDKLFDRYA